jgi:hypothetical protein
LVLSFSEQTKQFECKPVVGTAITTKTNLVKVRVRGERKTITVSTEHPFYVRTFHKARNNLSGGNGESDGEADAEGEWIEAADLKVGQEFLRPDRAWTRITEIKREAEQLKSRSRKSVGYQRGNIRHFVTNTLPKVEQK